MSKNLYRQLGKRMKSLRHLSKLTQEELAEKADLSVNFVSAIERGAKKPTLDTVERISSILGVRMEELFHFIDDPNKDAKELIQEIVKTLQNREIKVIKFFRNLIVEAVEAFS